MDTANCGSSLYHEILCLYLRRWDEKPSAYEGKRASDVEAAWPHISRARGRYGRVVVSDSAPANIGTCSTVEIPLSKIRKDDHEWLDILLKDQKLTDIGDDVVLRIQELHSPEHREEYVGAIGLAPPKAEGDKDNFRLWTSLFILAETRFPMPILNPETSDEEAERLADKITDLFDYSIRNMAPHDEWYLGDGRRFFKKRVLGFTKRRAMVEFILPAFPCKSSNGLKTSGIMPDEAEVIALEVLRDFIEGVEKIYEPGAKILIVSDGHVFSDCIGVDDGTVDQYGSRLTEIGEYATRTTGKDDHKIEYLSLPNLFFSNPDLVEEFPADYVEKTVEVPHHIETGVSDEAEACRKLMLATCELDRDILHKQLKEQDPSLLALYRGFSRFMLEDLALLPQCKNMSKSARRKLSTNVAFEMMVRNQAYSNLVELLFPCHIRLSIHAHKNSGPKFGVCLFPRDKVKAVESLSDGEEQKTQDLLHTPTPWHNCIVQIDGDPMRYLVKAQAVLDALFKGAYGVHWVERQPGDGEADVPIGGHYVLKKKPVQETAPVLLPEDNTLHDRAISAVEVQAH